MSEQAWCVFTQSNAQVQGWRGKGLLMFPGLFIQPSVWLKADSHPFNPPATSSGPPSRGSHHKRRLRYDWWRAWCGKKKQKKELELPSTCFLRRVKYTVVYSMRAINQQTTTDGLVSGEGRCVCGGGGWALLSISNSSCYFLYKRILQALMICYFFLKREVESELRVHLYHMCIKC